MKVNRKIIYMQYIFAIFMGVLLILFEVCINKFITHSVKYYVLLFLISILFSIIILRTTKSFVPCNWMAITVCIIILFVLLFEFITQRWRPSNHTVFFIITNWLGISASCIVFQFFQKHDLISGFNKFFKINSIAFSIIYLLIIIYIAFLKGISFIDTQYYRKINLSPFTNTIIPYITGMNRVNFDIAASNIIANILLFAPLGFYLAMFSR